MNRIDTELGNALKGKIRTQGPMTFRDFMAAALYDENMGFYSKAPKIGSPEGPFDTNARFPAFGYAIAKAITYAEKAIGFPLRVLELGGGTGQLGNNIISCLENDHEYVVLEPSQGLRAHQQRRGLQSIQNLDSLPPKPTFVFGNEVLDALPVHRVMGMGPEEVLELYVDLDEDGEFCEQPRPLSTMALAERLGDDRVQLGRGQVAEICLELKPFLKSIWRVVDPGYVIFVDYGDRASNLYSHRHRNGTLRSYYHQQQIYDQFFAVGQQDLTADVDYTAACFLAEEVGFEVDGLIPQGIWLRNLGILDYKGPTGDRESDQEEIDVLTRPAGLGSTFDVLIFKTKGLSNGPGLQSAS
ncbi:SAM-dependent methyltransferase [uncultured Nitrospira sp.]|uniref:SAM-dependent methyltransferase n=1 Tax=uncultured Nitrospira sp. TaxID=157176 RepID=UPI003140C450